MPILSGNLHTWSHTQNTSAQPEDCWRNDLAMIRPNQHRQNIQDRETCQAWEQALFLLSSTSSDKFVLLRLHFVDKDCYRNERSVISKQWSAQTLPLQCNSALVSVTILVDNTKTQWNEFVATCWGQNKKGLYSVLTSLAVLNVLLMLIGPDHGKIFPTMILCLRTRGLGMLSCMQVVR